jgi:hypothetical protein
MKNSPDIRLIEAQASGIDALAELNAEGKVCRPSKILLARC